jgi:hypothetical protein
MASLEAFPTTSAIGTAAATVRKIGEATAGFTYGAMVAWVSFPGKEICRADPATPPTCRTPSTSSSPFKCPVCRYPPENLYITICGHTYCKECFVDQCSLPSIEFPIRCFYTWGEQQACEQPLSMYDLEQVLPPRIMHKLLEDSFRQYVRAHPAKFRYCPVPACSRLNLVEQSVRDAPVRSRYVLTSTPRI